MKAYQVTGPAWLDTEFYEITATMPPETTPDQFHVMLQNLLAERFRMKAHRETKDLPMYSMVLAKGGLKIKETEPAPPVAEGTPLPAGPQLSGPLKMGPDGFPVFPNANRGRPSMTMSMQSGRMKMTGQEQTMQSIANLLTNQLGRPVTDETHVAGKFSFTLTFSSEGLKGFGVIAGAPPPSATSTDTDSEPDLLSAIQSQLGLKLEPHKGPVELIVVDSADSKPIEN